MTFFPQDMERGRNQLAQAMLVLVLALQTLLIVTAGDQSKISIAQSVQSPSSLASNAEEGAQSPRQHAVIGRAFLVVDPAVSAHEAEEALAATSVGQKSDDAAAAPSEIFEVAATSKKTLG